MALLGPMVVVAEASAADLIDVLGKAGAFPIVETRWTDAPAAIAEIQPVALAIADPEGVPSPRHLRAVTQCIGALQDENITAEDIAVRRPTLDAAFLHLTRQPPPDSAVLSAKVAMP